MQPNVWYKASDLMNALGVKAVSYTHLDVYKRQPYWIPAAVDAPAPAPIITQSVFLIFFAALSIWSSYASFWNT